MNMKFTLGIQFKQLGLLINLLIVNKVITFLVYIKKQMDNMSGKKFSVFKSFINSQKVLYLIQWMTTASR